MRRQLWRRAATWALLSAPLPPATMAALVGTPMPTVEVLVSPRCAAQNSEHSWSIGYICSLHVSRLHLPQWTLCVSFIGVLQPLTKHFATRVLPDPPLPDFFRPDIASRERLPKASVLWARRRENANVYPARPAASWKCKNLLRTSTAGQITSTGEISFVRSLSGSSVGSFHKFIENRPSQIFTAGSRIVQAEDNGHGRGARRPGVGFGGEAHKFIASMAMAAPPPTKLNF